MARLLTLLFLFVAVIGCGPPEAVIIDFSPTRAIIASDSDNDDEQGTILKKAQSACDLGKSGSAAIQVSITCASKSPQALTSNIPQYDSYGRIVGYKSYTHMYSLCDTYHHLFACKDRSVPNPDS